MSVNVLMCTYNGENYLREQIDSILAQTYEELRLFVRDDGSTDGTMHILDEYVNKYPNKVIKMDTPQHLGYPDCFWDMLLRCPVADYYAFSDQDDAWAPEKIECAVKMLSKAANDADSGLSGTNKNANETERGDVYSPIPVLYIHDYDNCDGALKVMSHHSLGSIDVLSDMSILFYTYASGFCMVINNSMRDMLNNMDLIGKSMYHDELCIWTAHFHGRILYDDRTLTKYRRHEATVTEYGNGIPTLISNWIRREIMGPEFGQKCTRIRTFLKLEKALETNNEYQPDIESKDKGIINRRMPVGLRRNWYLLSGGRMTIPRYLKRLLFPHRLRPSIGGEIALRIMFLMGKCSN
ncbi:glycosyltransferase [Butyrivibrio sp. JL13D10]|uniref:glycosyltransferase n=1 Tax=Butyrivibrio sp. JL13D10 TaxID=3236815 RepID=UPI0038B4E988